MYDCADLLVARWKLPGAFLILDITEASLIWWWILVSSRCHTRIGETSRLYTTSASTPVGLWSAKRRCAFTCRSGFPGSTSIIQPFLDLRRWLGLLSQRMWLWHFRILWSMSLPRRRGIGRQGRRNRGSLRRGTSNGSTMYLILCSATMCPLLCIQLMFLLRGGYCWTVVGQISSRPTPNYWEHQSQSG